MPWDIAVLRTAEGTPYLAPELRSKDGVDAVEVIPCLNAQQRDLLSRLLESNHPWQRRLD